MPNDLFKRLPISLAVLQALAMWSNAYALPTGEAIQAGQATFQHNGNTLRIDQSSAKAIVNWQSFNIGKNEAVNLFQPNHGAALFRILGPEASQIFGSLSATGSLFLSNPNGILFAPGSRVDVGSLVATTMRINNADFMSGNYQFFADPNHPDSSVINQGVIRTTDGGYLVLLGNKVENSGSLQANNGSVVLGSAESAVLDFYGDGLVKVNLSGDALNAAIEQTGNITANGGAVQLAVNARTAALNVDGVIQANSLVERNGVIRLEGGAGSKVKVTGTLQASGKDEGTTGGNVTVSGEQVALLDTAVVDASGQNGGGTVLIGGDYQGKNAGVQNARTTYISNGTTINADATRHGDGGKVVVWSDNTTRYYGNISAQGGMLSGNGGFVEVSGKQNLDFLGGINVGAAYGSGGRVLLDPQDILLNTSPQPSPANNANGSPDIAFADAPAVGTTTVQITDITGFSELFLQATRDITIASALTMATNNSIRLEANNNINVNAATAVSGTGSINLRADADNSGAGNLAVGGNITSQSGGITLSGATITRSAGSIASTGAGNSDAGNISITSTGSTNLGAAAITANGGTASAGTPGRNGGAITINANGFTTTGTITASGSTGNGADSIGGNAGSITINSTNGISAGTLTASGNNAGTTGNANGGTGGTIAINNTTSGAISVGAVNSRAGNSIGTGTSLGGSVALSNTASGDVTTGAITTSGNNNSNAHGGTIQISSATGNINVGALVSSAGTVRAGNSGKDAGAITINSGGSFTGTTITANGSISNGVSQNGGNGAAISITSTSGITATTVTANGDNASVTDGNGGSAGSITMSNTGSGNISTAALTTRTGNSAGTGINGTQGFVMINNTSASGTIVTGAINTFGAASGTGHGGIGGDVTIIGNGDVTVGGALNTSAGTSGTSATSTRAGRNAGNVTIAGANTSINGTITASGGAGFGLNQTGGNAGVVAITGSGSVNTVAITTSAGAATGTGTGGTEGAIMLEGSTVTAGALTTTGGGNGNGGDIDVTSTTGNITVGAITASGGTAIIGNAGRNAGTIALNSAGTVTATTITANGSSGNGTLGNLAGGNAAVVSINGVGGITTTSIGASGGHGAGVDADGGSAGIIAINNNDSGDITTTNLTARSGNATGSGALATPATFVIIGNASDSGGITTGAIDTSGLTNSSTSKGHGGYGGNVIIAGNGDVTVGGTLNTSAGTAGGAATGTQAGRNAGHIIILSSGGDITAADISANGSAGFGSDQTGGNAGAVLIGGAGALNTAAISARTGNATGTGAGGIEGAIMLGGSTVTTGTLTTTGGSNGDGGNIEVISTSGNMTLGAIASSGGTAVAGNAGRNAGAVTLDSAGIVTTTSIAAKGSSGNGALGNLAGGNAAAVSINSVGGITATAIDTSGGAASTTNAKGGDAGSIVINNSGAGNITTTTLTSKAGNAAGTGTGGAAGSVDVTNTAAGGNISTTTITTAGATNAHGGNVLLSSLGNITVTGTITTSGGAAGTGVTAAGRNAGNVTITGVDHSVTSTITASGGNALGTNQAGGNAGMVSITGSGTLNTAAINSRSGNATGTGLGGSVGGITLNGTSVASGILTTSGGTNGNGGDVDVTATNGTLAVGGISATGTTKGNATLLSSGEITQAGAIAVGTLNATTANNAGANITLLNAGNAVTTVNLQARTGTTAAVGAANASSAVIQYRDTDALVVAGINNGTGAGGNVNLIAGNAITQTGAIKANVLAVKTRRNGGSAITLNDAGNDANSINLQSRNAADTTNAAGAVAYVDSNGFDVATINTSSNATLTASNAITQTGAIAASTLAATTLNNSGAAITLNNAGNAVTTLSLSARNAANTANAAGALSYRDTDGFVISNLRTTADATLQNGGAVTQSAAIAAAGLSLLGSGSYILSTSTNDIATLAANTSNAITYRDTNAVSVGSVNGTNGITTNNTVTLTASGAITQTQAIAATTLTARTLNNTGAAITLNNPANDVATVALSARNAADSANAAGAISYVDANAFNMLASATTSTLTAKALTSNLSVGGALAASKVLLQADAGDVTLNSTVTSSNAANDALVIAASNGRFINNAGAAALNATGSRWVVYSKNAHDDSFGGLVSGNKAIWGQSNTSLAPTSVAAGNRFVFNDAVLNVTTTNGGKTYGDLGNVASNYSIGGDALTNFSNAYLVETLGSIGNSGAADITSAGTAVTANVAGSPYAINGAIGTLANTGGFTYNFVNNGLLTVAARALTVTADTGQTKVYGNTDPANFTYTSNAVNGDTFAGALARASGENVGNYAINQGTLDVGTNYSLTYISNDFSISKRAITVSTGDVIKTYDGTLSAAGVATVAVGNLVGGDSLNGGSFAFTDKNFGINNKTVTVGGVTVSDGNGGGNYDVNFADNISSTINKKDITAVTGITANNKVYDGNTSATLNTGSLGFTGIVGGETLNVGGATGVFNSKNVVGATTVNISGLTLADGSGLASNYNLTDSTASAAANITAKALTASVTAPDKVYDGNTTAAPTLAITAGLVGTETVGATGSATFNSKDVLAANLVTVNSTSLADGTNGGLASNYSLASGQTVAANITAKALTASVTAPDKVYDGNTTAAPTLAITAGLVGTETVGATGSATFNSKDVLAANLVTVNSTSLADGTNGGLASNYSLASGQTVAANITAKALTASVTAPDKVYDGNTTAAPTLAITAGLVGTETVGATGSATFNSKDVLAANLVTVNSTSLADGTNGGLASNYSLASGQTVAANITPRAISITADAGQTKVYGSVDPIFTFTVGGLGIATGDALSGNLNRATGETVGAYAMNQGSLAVPDASNYIVTYIGNNFNILQPASTTGLPSTTAGLVDLNPKLGAYTGSQLFILSLAPSAAGGDGTSADANLPQCESNPDKLAKDKDFSIMINYGLNLPEGLNNTCI